MLFKKSLRALLLLLVFFSPFLSAVREREFAAFFSNVSFVHIPKNGGFFLISFSFLFFLTDKTFLPFPTLSFSFLFPQALPWKTSSKN